MIGYKKSALRMAAALAGYACVSFASVSADAQESVHTQLNGIIKQYSGVTGASMTNPDVKKLFDKDGFSDYLADYPVGNLALGYVWKVGMGATFTGHYSKVKIKAPFTDYVPLPDGPVFNPKKTYRIGFVFHGFNNPWLMSLADTAAWEAARHPNVQIDIVDAQFDDNRMSQVIDGWIAKKYDGIVLWPNREAPMGPPVDRAIAAGISVVSVDRRTSSTKISSEVMGNFYANGVQQGIYLQQATGGQGNLIMNRKDLGSTADAIRSGAFLQTIGKSNGYHILASYQVNSDRTLAFKATADALQAYKNISVVFNAGGEEAMGALDAIREAKRLNSGPGGKKLVILADDDANEVLKEVKDGNIDMVAPYTPLIGDVGVRVVLEHIGFKEGLIKQAPPKLVLTPNLPMITRTKMKIGGIETVTPDEWPYGYGPGK
ncbi:sugar ABC transporter substrate-binding protein [Caballeronia sp. DA-9]|uniref:sugar ABC transporter substrate-binding protein n=1 Tax=Caballeronia sp. DA-9 TaxID=3436237 RepID=UPI003F67AD7E